MTLSIFISLSVAVNVLIVVVASMYYVRRHVGSPKFPFSALSSSTLF